MSSRASYSVDTISKLLLLTPRRAQLLGLVFQAYVGYLKKRTIGTEVKINSLNEAYQRKIAAKAKLAETLFRENTNELLSLDQVRMVWEELNSTSRM